MHHMLIKPYDRARRPAMKRFIPVLMIASLSLILISCSSQRPLTRDLISEYNLDKAGLKKLQLYLSNHLRLEREVANVDKNIQPSHSLLKIEDRLIEQINFKKNTPCIITDVEADKLYVAFEKADNLVFQLVKRHSKGNVYCYTPDDNSRGIRYPERLTDEGSFVPVGIEYYADKDFYSLIKRGKLPYLLVEQKKLKKKEVEKRNVEGMRHDE